RLRVRLRRSRAMRSALAARAVPITNPCPWSAGDSCRPDQQIEDAHFREVVASSGELPPGRAQRTEIEVEVALVAADERQRAFSERSVYPEVIVGQVRLDDAVEHGDECGAFRMKRLRHLRETDPTDVCERIEESPQSLPRHQPSCHGQ